jgi:hypothetical protein
MNGKLKIGIKGRLERRIFYSPDGCWLWLGQKRKECGYGLIKINGRLTRVHRVSYETFKGPIPDGLFVCHRCDVPLCLNPDHLFLGTLIENNLDMYLKGRNYISSGDENPRSKLRSFDIPNIIEMRRQGMSYSEIGVIYGVSANCIRSIFTGRTWSQLKLIQLLG